MRRPSEPATWDNAAHTCESDRAAEMRAALDRADARLVVALLTGVGVEEAEEIQAAAAASAATLFGSG